MEQAEEEHQNGVLNAKFSEEWKPGIRSCIPREF